MATTSEITIAPLPTSEEVALTLLQWMFSNVGIPTDYNIGSIIRTYSEAIGSTEEIEGITSQAQAIQALVYSAYSAFGISPLLATPSVGSAVFSTLSMAPLPSGQSILIPLNSVIQTSAGVQYITTSNVILVSGTSSVSAPIQSVLSGANTNAAANTINQIASGLAYPLGVTNPLPTAGGQDAETAAQTLTRFLAYVDSLGLCTPIAVASAAKTVSYQQESVQYSACFDKETEILTKEGWIYFSDLINKPFCEVATLNPDTHELEYQEVEKYHKYWYKGELVTVQNDILDLATTPNHKMYVRPDANVGKVKPKYRFVEAKDLRPSQHMKRDCTWKGAEVEFYKIGEYQIPMDVWIEFIGYFLSEGSTGEYELTKKSNKTCKTIGSCNRQYCGYHNTYLEHKTTDQEITQYTVSIAQSNQINRKKMKACLEQLSFTVFESDHDLQIRSKLLVQELKDLVMMTATTKSIPKYLKGLAARQLKILLDALTLGDGMRRDPQGRTEWRYFTSSKKLADDVQEIVLKCGLASSIKIDDRRGRAVVIKDRGITGYTKHIQYIVAIHRYTLEPCMVDAISTREYNEYVYCVTVPNHIIYVRRNGKTCWVGQCIEPWISGIPLGTINVLCGFVVAIDNGSGSASTNLLNAVTNWLNIGPPAGYRPAGVPFDVIPVSGVTCSTVVVGQSINPALASAIQIAIGQAILGYFSTLNFGDTAQLTQLIAAVADVSFGQLTSLSVTLLDQFSNPQTTILANGALAERIILEGYSVTIN